MPSLVQLAGKTVRAQLDSGAAIDVRALSAKAIVAILNRFPEVSALFMGKSMDLNAESLIARFPDAVNLVIAYGAGDGSEADEEAASLLAVGDQLAIISEIVKLTIPRGTGPLVDRLRAMASSLGLDLGAVGKAQATK